jgi:SAM-dependent methyltransferase
VLTPARRRGVELLDDPALDPALATRSLRDVARANLLFGGVRAVIAALAPLLERAQRERRTLVLLDVGTGLGDIPRAARAFAQKHGVTLTTIGVELTAALALAARPGAERALTADARALPFASGSIDIVTCSQVLHHFERDDADALLSELTRVAGTAVIVSDLRRSWIAAGLLWLVSFPLGFHPISRHDGIVSIFRGYTAIELRAIVRQAVQRSATVRHRLGWRVTASWSPR